MSLGFVLAILVSGFITGALARLAIPGPDPMPIWLTIAIGLIGSIVGAVVGNAISHDNGYRHLVPLVRRRDRARRRVPAVRAEATDLRAGRARVSRAGLGVEQQRERLQKLGIDPNALRPDPAQLERAAAEAMLQELHRAGLLDDEELAAKRDGARPALSPLVGACERLEPAREAARAP